MPSWRLALAPVDVLVAPLPVTASHDRHDHRTLHAATHTILVCAQVPDKASLTLPSHAQRTNVQNST